MAENKQKMKKTLFKKEQRKRTIIKVKPFLYDSLDNIPKKIFLRVLETDNVFLLSNVIEDENELKEIWESMRIQHMDFDQSTESRKILRLSKNIDVLESQHDQILLSIESLRFDDDEPELIELIRGYGFQLRNDNNDNFHNDLSRIEREVNSLVIKANALKKMLPKFDENKKYTYDDIIASYSVILGLGLNSNKLTYTQDAGFAKQVDSKIKALEAQTAANKSRNGK